jgi:hypothetical protein
MRGEEGREVIRRSRGKGGNMRGEEGIGEEQE